MKNMEMIHQRKNRRVLLLLGGLVLVSLLCVMLFYMRHKNSAAPLEAVVQYEGAEILRVPLSEDAMYLLKDGTAEAVDMDATLGSLGTADPEANMNLLELKDGEVRMAESNCANQICVHTAPLGRAGYDFPITCLPHGLVITVE